MRAREKYLPQGTRKQLGLTDYIKHRRETGICETCNQEMKTHDRCEACGILLGSGHDCHLAPYLGHDICWPCDMEWHKKEQRSGQLISFEKFKGHEAIGRPLKRKAKVKSTRRPVRPKKQHGEFTLSIREG